METDAECDGRFSRGRPCSGLVLMMCLCIGFSGCTSFSKWLHNDFKVGPNYSPPATQVPLDWIDVDNPSVSRGNPEIARWWDVFGDPILTKLIHDAASQNLTVRQAGIQIMQSRIQRGIARSELLPQGQNLTSGYTHGELSQN